jgi:hypothetical protein
MSYMRSFNHPVQPQLFSGTAPREFRILFDRAGPDLAAYDTEVWNFLEALTDHAFISSLQYAGTTAPPDVERVETLRFGVSAPRGWVEISEAPGGIFGGPDYWACWAASDDYTLALVEQRLSRVSWNLRWRSPT